VPFVVASILKANEALHQLDGFAPGSILEAMDGAERVQDGMRALGFFDVLRDDHRDALQVFLESLPAALDAAIVAAVRSALRRGLRTQISWQPGYDFELRVWEVSQEVDDGWAGLLNVHILSPHPDESATLG
jgi:hypothetical protein